MEIVILGIVCLILGVALLFVIRKGNKETFNDKSEELQQTINILQQDKVKLTAELDFTSKTVEELKVRQQDDKVELNQLRSEKEEYKGLIEGQKEQIKTLQEKLDGLKEQSQNNQELLKNDFKVLANEILKSNQKEFSHHLLSPFQEKIKFFEKEIKESFEKEMRDKVSLMEEVKKLHELNVRISEEANNLTNALKGDQKQQGNWGEFILESILEKSGLAKGSEYFTQQSFTDEYGKRYQPDVVVKLPEEKDIVIDSKVSLVAYERFISADSSEEQEQHLKDHLLSMRSHIKSLSEKKYHLIDGVNAPDFVLLFTPIETSFSLALKEDKDLFQFAWERNIVLVSPTTLLATLKTIASVWKHEKQTKNAIKIAEESGKLYDGFVRFLESLEEVDKHLAKTREAYEQAHKRLSTGRGNLIKKVEDIRKLGANASKKIDSKYTADE